jgi:serine/threonine-protein kinase
MSEQSKERMATRTVHDRYRILGEIGRGGMGAVYLAEDERLPGRRCALKEVRLPTSLPAEAAASLRAAFLAEAALLARLDHPGLPRVSDHFEDSDASFLVMDFVPGQDLAAVLDDARSRGRPLDARQVVLWGERLCDILTYLHQQRPPIVHRDVKPANIKLTPDGQLKLVDFGLAAPGGTEPQAVTVTVQAGGSRPYQPLEQYGGAAEPDPRSDIYALGASMYHLLGAQAPPSARERFLDRGALRSLSELRSDVPQPVQHAIDAAMSLHPDQRPPTAVALRRLLAAGLTAGESPSEPAPQVLVGREDGLEETWPVALRANVWPLLVVFIMLAIALTLTMAP